MTKSETSVTTWMSLGGRPQSLSSFMSSHSEETKNKFVESTSSGTLVLNDTFTQVGVHEMPFGGSGDSGCGRLFLPKHRPYIHPNILDGSYLGNFSFNNFVNRRSFINVPPLYVFIPPRSWQDPTSEPFLGYRYPPYSEEAFQALSAGANIKIPNV
ncbi:hypothetical protein B0H14DRAFT_3693309 [Mycena olivaceomarginata]|nr:hypothetical protein B0H14DRAFT_3693309 [Mycena olivaceomarginata]